MLPKATRKRPDLEGSSAVKAPSRLVGGRRLQHPALLALLCKVLLTSAQAPAASSLNGVSSVVHIGAMFRLEESYGLEMDAGEHFGVALCLNI